MSHNLWALYDKTWVKLLITEIIFDKWFAQELRFAIVKIIHRNVLIYRKESD
jgi:hypothetical protein